MELSKIAGTLDTPVNYHRLMKGPLDDREVFATLDDLMEYCNNGACYDGQRVVVVDPVIGTFVEYVIVNNIPIIDLRGSEPIFFKNGTDIYMLLFEENLVNGQKWGKNIWFSLEEGRYNILSQTAIFKINNNYYYNYNIIDKIKNTTTNGNHTDSKNIFKDNGTGMACNVNNNINLNKLIIGSYTAIDNNNTDKIVRLWIRANNYYDAYNIFREGDLANG